MARRGRKRKVGPREPNGQLQRVSAPKPELWAIYVITQEGQLAVKIGRSANPEQRIKDLQVGAVGTVRCYWACRCLPQEAVLLEAEIHRQLRRTAYHVRGEWYAVSPYFAAMIVTNFAAKFDINIWPDARYGRALERDVTDEIKEREEFWRSVTSEERVLRRNWISEEGHNNG